MSLENLKSDSFDNIAIKHEVQLKDVIIGIKRWINYLISKWLIIFFLGIIGAVLGFYYAWSQKPVYKAELMFSLEDQKGGGGLSSALGLASQFGVDIGGSGAGGEFSSENILILLKSRSIIEKALLNTIVVDGKETTLVEFYMSVNKIRQTWKNKPDLINIKFSPNADRSKFSLKQDSVLGEFWKHIVAENLDVVKLEKASGIFSLKIVSSDQVFAKAFSDVLVKVVSSSYIEKKTAKALNNVSVLQLQTDSVRRQLNMAISGVAASTEANPNANASRQTLHVASQRRQVDVQANTAILNELVKNLELSKMSLLQATPLIQIIDRPVLPLEKKKPSKLISLVLGGIIGAWIAIISLTLRKQYKKILANN